MTDRELLKEARDIVDKIRELECDWLYELPHDEAAALIEGYGRRVPRAMLETIENQAFEYCKEPFLSYESIDQIAYRYGVKIEGAAHDQQ